jgi:hypothetical protein
LAAEICGGFSGRPAAGQAEQRQPPFRGQASAYNETRARRYSKVKKRPVVNLVLNVFRVDFDSGAG